MTRTRVIAALVMAPTAIAAILLLPTPWLAAVAALAMLTGLWEWLKLAGVDDSLPRTVNPRVCPPHSRGPPCPISSTVACC